MIAHALDSLLNRGASAPQASWLPGARMLRTSRGALRACDSGGTGPVVLMVPDGPNVIEHHAPVIERLAPHARVICFDMPGFGFSRPTLGYDHGLQAGAETVLAVMDALISSKPHCTSAVPMASMRWLRRGWRRSASAACCCARRQRSTA